MERNNVLDDFDQYNLVKEDQESTINKTIDHSALNGIKNDFKQVISTLEQLFAVNKIEVK